MQNVSIIVTCEEQQSELRALLPDLLSLQYGGEYEVIVVDMKHDKDLAEWLEEMEVQNPHLSHTFCPASARGINVDRLAFTLGAKAAVYDWLILMSPLSASPLGEDFGKAIVAFLDYANDATDVVVGVTGRKRWNWLTKRIFRRRFNVYRPTSSIVLCRRDSLLKGELHITKDRFINLFANR